MDSITDILRGHARASPDRIALTFLRDGERDAQRMTYADLDLAARRVARRLEDACEPGDRVMLLYPSGLDYVAAFVGCLYSARVAVPAHAPDAHRIARAMPRLEAIASDADAAAILTTRTLDRALREVDTGGRFAGMRLVTTDGPAVQDDARHEIVARRTGVAFLQYTSGSTGNPKGVMVTHQNLLHTLDDMGVGWNHCSDSVFVSWLPIFHDLGLIYGVLEPLYIGGHGVLMPPLAFLERPGRWLETISRHRGTHSAAPNFAYELCVRKCPQDADRHIDLSSWEVALNAAEPIRAETLERFSKRFAGAGLRAQAMTPGYGLAEAALKVTTVGRNEPALAVPFDAAALLEGRVIDRSNPAPGGTSPVPVRWLVGCGRSALGTEVRVVDPITSVLCEPGVVGEIWVKGRGIAAGYWNRPEQTATTFQARIRGSNEGPFLRTGDLGFVHRGQLFVAGRLKDLIICAGRNHHPQDLERTAEQAHPALRLGCGAAFSIDLEGEERVVLVQEIERRYHQWHGANVIPERRQYAPEVAAPSPRIGDMDAPDLPAIAQGISRRIVLEHDVRPHAVLLVMPGTIPKTSSGKIRRQACRAAFLAGTLRVVFEWRAEIEEAPYTELGDTARTPKQRAGEDELVRLVQEHLARAAGMALQDVRVSCSPNDLGIPSLALASAAGAIAEALGIGSLSLARFATNSLAETARALAAGSEAFVPVTATAPECDGVPTREGASISFGGHGGVALRALVWRSAAGQRPLLIVHGLWENAHLWEHVASRLAQKRDVYVIELRGHGESGRPAEGGYAPSDYALDLEAAAARIEAPQIDVLGFCVGAFAVMSLAAARPGWVHRCILQEPWNGTVDPGQLAAFAALKRETLRTVVAQMRNLFPTRPDWAITKLARALRETANGVFEVENARAEQDLRPLMRRCRSPTLVLRADPNLGGAVDETFSRDLSANLPDAAIVDFPNTSRAIQVERPRLLIELAERFFRGEGTASIPAFFR